MSRQKHDLNTVDPYYAQWGDWEMKPWNRARKNRKLIFKSNFSPTGIVNDWLADGVSVESKNNCAVVALAPEDEAFGREWGLLWAKTAFSQPLAVEVEFTLDAKGPHDANIFWGQKEPSKENLGKEQECYMAGYFGWGGKACGFERASDWHNTGITGVLNPRPGVKRAGTWIVYNKRQYMYLDGKMVMFSEMMENPPASGYLSLGVYMSKVKYHSVTVFKLRPAKI
jgi:hypothetical protein